MPTYDLATLQDFVYDRIEDNNLLYPAAELTVCINEAVRVINLFTGFCQTSVQLPGLSVANQLLYSTPAPILFPTRIAYEGRDLDKVGLIRISQDYRNWATDTSTSYGPTARWVPIGLGKFAMHPIDAIGGKSVTVTGVREPALLVNASDVMQLEDPFVTLIVEYCAHRLVLKEGGKVFADASVLIQTFWKEMRNLRRGQGFKAPRYFVQVQEPS